MEWKMEWKISGIKWKTIFHTNFILNFEFCIYQRRSPRGHILKSLASKPQVLENCPVLGSRTELFFELLKLCWKRPETLRNICKNLFYFPQLEHWCSQGSNGLGPPPIEISPMIKNVTKKPIVSSISV